MRGLDVTAVQAAMRGFTLKDRPDVFIFRRVQAPGNSHDGAGRYLAQHTVVLSGIRSIQKWQTGFGSDMSSCGCVTSLAHERSTNACWVGRYAKRGAACDSPTPNGTKGASSPTSSSASW